MTHRINGDAGVPRRSGRRGLPEGPWADVVAVLVTYVVLGLVCGVLWWLLVDPASFTKHDEGGSMGELDLTKRFNADGWYAVLALVAGVLSGGLLTWWRSRDFRLTTVLVFLGSFVAAALSALVGRSLGPEDPDRTLAAVEIGQQVPVELMVSAKAGFLVWPMAVLIGALLVLWSPPKDTDQ